MEVVLMVTVVVRETQCAGATTAGSLVCITIRAMTAVIILPPSQIPVLCAMLRYMGCHHHLPLVRDVQGGTIMDKDVAPLITPVVRERVTVMAMVMEGGVMVIEGARVTWYVVETIARSLVLTTMRRMTVVRSLAIKDGVTGVAGHLVTVGTNTGSEFARGSHVICQHKRKLARLEDSTDDYSVYHFRTTNLFYTSILHIY